MIAAAKPLAARHTVITIGIDGLREVLAACPVPLSTMGRLDDDPAYSWRPAAAPPPSDRAPSQGP